MSKPCIHGNLCRAYLNKFGRIFSNTCPANCKYYLPQDSYYANFIWHHKGKAYKCVLSGQDGLYLRIDVPDYDWHIKIKMENIAHFNEIMDYELESLEAVNEGRKYYVCERA